jgi:predicted nucleic acid-binding protein
MDIPLKQILTVPRDDIFVAATALHHGIPVYARNPHFALMRTKGGLPLKLA